MLWIGTDDTDFANPLNWADATNHIIPATDPPNATDIAFLTNGGTISGAGTVSTLTFGGAAWTVTADLTATASASVGSVPTAVRFESSGTLAGAALTATGGFTLLYSTTPMVVTAEKGASFTGFSTEIGGNGGTGTLVLADPTTRWTDHNIFVGGGQFPSGAPGSGVLVVTKGASLTNAGDNETSEIGFFANHGTGLATVSAGGTWTNQNLIVAEVELGVLNVQTGGTVSTTGFAIIGDQATAMGTVTVEGLGSAWRIANSLTIGGLGGSGTLDVISQGTVDISSRMFVGRGGDFSGTPVSGSGSVNIGAGGTVNVLATTLIGSGTSAVQLGSTAGSAGTISVNGAGAFLNVNTHWVNIGNIGQGAIFVGQGGSVLAGTKFTADAATVLGSTAGATGLLTVTDPGSTYQAIGQLDVGLSGSGTLLVANQGTVLTGNNPNSTALGFVIGFGAGSSGTVTVKDAGSQIVNVGHFNVGGSGNSGNPIGGVGTLLIENGGLISTTRTASSLAAPAAVIAADPGTSGSNATVTGQGSVWQIDGAMIVGQLAAGSLSAVNAGTVSVAGDVAIGISAIGTIAVTGGGRLMVGGELDLGGTGSGPAGGTGALTVTGAIPVGGTVTVGGTVSVGTVLHLWSGSLLTLDAASAMSIGGVVGLTAGEVSVGATGAIVGAGIVDGTIRNAGTITAFNPAAVGPSTTLEITGMVSGTGTLDFGSNNVALELDTTPSAGQTVRFGPLFSGNTLILNSPSIAASGGSSMFAGLAGVSAGDRIDFGSGIQITGLSQVLNGGAYDVTVAVTQGGSTGFISFDNVTFAPGAAQFVAGTDSNGDASLEAIPCFCAGTRIATPAGEVPVERLTAGSLVTIADGRRLPLRWVGFGNALLRPGQRSAATPIIVRAGALADRVPTRDLRLTKGHSLYLDGVLIPVENLINHRTILWDDAARTVQVFHLELDTHEVLLANGAAAESYRDDGNRALFQNVNPAWNEREPPDPCAPIITNGPVVEAVWQRLLLRAKARRAIPLTTEPDVHLLVDGERTDPITVRHGLYLFEAAGIPGELQIASRYGVPSELGLNSDQRRLGIAVQRIILRQGGIRLEIDAESSLLSDGFHLYEAGGYRWTDGAARLPPGAMALFAGDAPVDIEVYVGCVSQYPTPATAKKRAHSHSTASRQSDGPTAATAPLRRAS
ncbi:MAG: Hint domain-containing protein [Acetobacteraceae bacterium]